MNRIFDPGQQQMRSQGHASRVGGWHNCVFGQALPIMSVWKSLEGQMLVWSLVYRYEFIYTVTHPQRPQRSTTANQGAAPPGTEGFSLADLDDSKLCEQRGEASGKSKRIKILKYRVWAEPRGIGGTGMRTAMIHIIEDGIWFLP